MGSSEEDSYHISSPDHPEYTPPKKKQKQSTLHSFMSAQTALDSNATSDSEIRVEIDPNMPTPTTSSSNTEGSNLYILKGKYFKIERITNGQVQAFCQICLPQKKIIKGSTLATTNFVKHLKRVHPDSFEKYSQKMANKKVQKMSNLKRSRSTISRDAITQKEFDTRILKFIINTMSSLSIIEHKSFLDLFQGINLKVMTRKVATKQINELYNENIQKIKNLIHVQKYVCTTTDIWSGRRRSFIGVTCHWLTDDFKRQSVALSCQRFKGTHDNKSIAAILQTIHTKFGITEEKVIATITDNGSNFVKAFKVYGMPNKQNEDDESQVHLENDSETDSEEDDELTDKILVPTEETNDEEWGYVLPKHKRCASHTLNLIATADCKKAINLNPKLRSRHTTTFHKCSLLWKKAVKPKSSEIIVQCLGHTLSRPGVTRWNSYFDSVKQILGVKSKLPQLLQKLGLKTFTDVEVQYLEEYCLVLQPIAVALDVLQGQDNTFYGMLLPTLLSVRNTLEKLKLKKFKYGGEVLLSACLAALDVRFQAILKLKEDDAIISAVVCPQFKLRWYNVIEENLAVTKEEIKLKLMEACEEFYTEDPQITPERKDDLDSFFDFNESTEQLALTSCSVSTTATGCLTTTHVQSKIELELLRYLNDKRKDTAMLRDYPLMQQVFLKYNTCLPSSASVERLFSFATIINAPRRHALTDENFEKLVVLKANEV